MQKQKLFSYTDYDKISDDLYYIGGGARLVLRMNVNLAKKMDDGSRRHFYNEYSSLKITFSTKSLRL